MNTLLESKNRNFVHIPVPSTIANRSLLKCIKRAVESKFNSTSEEVREYMVEMHYDGYGVALSVYNNNKHFVSWDSLHKEVKYFRGDKATLSLVAKFINAVTLLGYEVESIRNEYFPPQQFNWQDFIAKETI